jgi:hypothetical protein
MIRPLMRKSPGLAICMLATLVVVTSGCGSSKTASTLTQTSANASPSATGSSGAPTTPQPTTTQGTGSKDAKQTGKATAPKATPAQPIPRATHSGSSATAPALLTKPVKHPLTRQQKLKFEEEPVNPPYDFPEQSQRVFMSFCQAAGSSRGGCECVITKFENEKVTEGRALGELLGTNLALRNRSPLNAHAKRYAKECKSTIA